MAASDARPVPRKNTAFRMPVVLRKNDGTLIGTWTGADSEVSIDGGAYADCTSEATEIGSSGTGYLDLTAAEMNGDMIMVKITFTNTGALPLVFTLYPEEVGDYRVNVEQFGGSAGTFSGGRPEVNASHAAGTAWNSGAITANTLAADAITAAKVAADVTTELQSGLATAANLATVAGYIDTEVAAIKAVTDALPDGGALTSLATAANLATVAGYLDTEIAAILADTNELQTDLANGGRLDLLIDGIKAKTDSLAFTVAGQVDANIQYVNDVQINGDGAGTPMGV